MINSAEPFAEVIKPFPSNVRSNNAGLLGFQPMIEAIGALEVIAKTEDLPAVSARDSPVDGTLNVQVGVKVGENLVIAVSIFFPTFT